MFDKYFCKHIDRKHIIVADVLWFALPGIFCFLMLFGTMAISVALFGWEVPALLSVGILVFIFILNIEVANCPNKEEDK